MTTARNLPSTIASFPAPTPQVSASMSSQELAEHRARISFEVEVVMSGYWQTDMDPRLRAAVMVDWADELEDWSVKQVKWALREWRSNNPRRKPNPGDIVGILKEQRGRAEAAKLAALPRPEPAPSKPVSAARAAEIMAELKFKRIERAAE